MVLLSVNAQLLPEGRKRLVCATTSVEHPSKPVFRSYTRMKLSVSGFIAEEDGLGGSRVTQLTDLSALGCKCKLDSTDIWPALMHAHSLGPVEAHQDGHRDYDPKVIGQDRSDGTRVSLASHHSDSDFTEISCLS